MNIAQLLIAGMILIIVATVTLAIVSYGAFKVRERRSPRPSMADAGAPMFFERVRVASNSRQEP
jgi:hypothetical protein